MGDWRLGGGDLEITRHFRISNLPISNLHYCLKRLEPGLRRRHIQVELVLVLIAHAVQPETFPHEILELVEALVIDVAGVDQDDLVLGRAERARAVQQAHVPLRLDIAQPRFQRRRAGQHIGAGEIAHLQLVARREQALHLDLVARVHGPDQQRALDLSQVTRRAEQPIQHRADAAQFEFRFVCGMYQDHGVILAQFYRTADIGVSLRRGAIVIPRNLYVCVTATWRLCSEQSLNCRDS